MRVLQQKKLEKSRTKDQENIRKNNRNINI